MKCFMEDIKIKVKWKMEDIKDYYNKNKDILNIFALTGVCISTTFLKCFMQQPYFKSMKRLKECYFYDDRVGHYCVSKRKLKAKEMIELDIRYNRGELISHILIDMGLLK